MKKQILILLTLLSSSLLFADNAKEIELIESMVQKEINSKEHSADKKLFLVLGAARELYVHRFYEKAEKYYNDAIAIPSNENKSEAYINLITIALNAKDKIKVKEQYQKAHIYFEKHKAFYSPEIKEYLVVITKYLGDSTETPTRGFYGHFLAEENFTNLLKDKKYDQALLAINPVSLEKQDNDHLKISYDLLNVRLNKEAGKKLKCEQKYQKYPKAYVYDILLCGLLSEHLKEGKFSPKAMARAQKYFTNTDPDRAYLFEILKEIK